VEVEGAEASGAGVLEGGIAGPGAVVEGEIRDTILGVYSFTFLKNSNISKSGRAWEEPTFS
jgi:hypothetical protein